MKEPEEKLPLPLIMSSVRRINHQERVAVSSHILVRNALEKSRAYPFLLLTKCHEDL